MSKLHCGLNGQTPRPLHNRTVVLADIECLAGSSRSVAGAMDEIERLINIVAPGEVGPVAVIFSCQRSVFNDSERLCSAGRRLGWRFVTPQPDRNGQNGADRALAREMMTNQLVFSSQRIIILGGDHELAEGARESAARGSTVCVVALEGSVSRQFEIPGITVVELAQLGSL